MAPRGGFGSGRNARFVCDGCGLAYPYRDARTEADTGFRKCRSCGVDPPDPVWLPAGGEAKPLRYPRPDRNELAGLLEVDAGEPLALGGGQGFLEGRKSARAIGCQPVVAAVVRMTPAVAGDGDTLDARKARVGLDCLEGAGAGFDVHVIVEDDRHFSARKRHDHFLAVEFPHPLVVRVHGHGHVGPQLGGTCACGPRGFDGHMHHSLIEDAR